MFLRKPGNNEEHKFYPWLVKLEKSQQKKFFIVAFMKSLKKVLSLFILSVEIPIL